MAKACRNKYNLFLLLGIIFLYFNFTINQVCKADGILELIIISRSYILKAPISKDSRPFSFTGMPFPWCKFIEKKILSPMLLLTGKPKCCTLSRGWGDSAYGLWHFSGGGPWRTPVSCQGQWISTSTEVLTLVEEYKQLVSAQPLLMPLKTELVEYRCHKGKWRGFTQQHSDRPPSSPRSVDSSL